MTLFFKEFNVHNIQNAMIITFLVHSTMILRLFTPTVQRLLTEIRCFHSLVINMSPNNALDNWT